MRNVIIITLAILAFIFVSGCGGGLDDLIKPKGIVTGTVIDGGTGDGLVGATVQCGGKSAVTGDYGRYTIEDVASGDQNVKVTCVGYIGLGDEIKPVTVIEDSTVDAPDLVLIKGSNGEVLLCNMPVNTSQYWENKHSMLNAVSYFDSVGATDIYFNEDMIASAEYNLYNKFKRFKAVVGVDDRCPNAESRCGVRVYVDGVMKFESDLGRSQVANIDLPVENALRIKLELIDLVGSQRGENWGSFGNAKVTQ
jgi:hypothetical protein